MTFTVKYRTNSGSIAEKAVEAANRADCFAKCKAQGIVPVGVEAGATAKKPAPASGSAASGKFRLVLLVAALAAVGAAVLLWPESKPTSDTVPDKKKTIAKATNPPQKKVKAETNAVPETAKPGEVAMKSLTAEERAAIRLEKLESRPLDLTVQSNRVFATGTEQIMAWVFMTEVGELPPPLPKIPDSEMVHLTEILLSENKIGDADSEKTAQAKEMVQAVKKELAEFIKNGGAAKDFFDYYRGELVQAYETRKTVRQSVLKILKEEPSIALDYLDEVNKELEGKGIKKITIHPKQLAHFGIKTEQ